MIRHRNAKVRRRDGTAEMFDFYDTYNPRENKVHNSRHMEWPVGVHRQIDMLKSFTIKRPTFETRTPFLTELPPVL